MLNNWETVAKKISALMAEKMKGLRATGIEPVSHAWEARVLPLNDARMWCAQILAPEFESVK